MVQALALWLAFAIDPRASGEIVGHVTDEIEGEATNQPIHAAQVRLYSLEQVFSTKSGPSGDFVFRKVPFGNYTLVVRASGFKAFRKPVTVTEKKPASVVKIAIGASSEPSSCNAPLISYADYRPSSTGHLYLKAADSSQAGRSLTGIVVSIRGPAGGPANVYTLVAQNGAANTLLPPDSYAVSVDGPGFHKQEIDVFVPRGNVTVAQFLVFPKDLQVACQ